MYVFNYKLQCLHQTLTQTFSLSAPGAFKSHLFSEILARSSSDLNNGIYLQQVSFTIVFCLISSTTVSVSLTELSYTKELSGKLFMALSVYRNGGYFSYDFSGLAGTPEATDCSVRPLEVAFGW